MAMEGPRAGPPGGGGGGAGACLSLTPLQLEGLRQGAGYPFLDVVTCAG